MNYQDSLSSLVEDSTRAKRNAMLMASWLKSGKAKRFIEPAILMAAAQKNADCYQSVSANWLYINLYIRDLPSFKGPEVEALLNVFEYMEPSDTETSEYPNALTKSVTYRFRNVAESDDGRANLNVVICVDMRVSSDSETCRKEVIGYTDPKPQPIYKLVCDDEVKADVVATEEQE